MTQWKLMGEGTCQSGCLVILVNRKWVEYSKLIGKAMFVLNFWQSTVCLVHCY